MRTSWINVTVTLLALAFAVFAVDAGESMDAANEQKETTVQDRPPEDSPLEPVDAISEEIVVTARKREDQAWQLPPSVMVLTSSDLHGPDPRTTSEIAAQVPNLEITSGYNAANPMIFLRGIGIPDFNANASGTVGLYADEVYLAAAAGQVLPLFDVERIEVLRGPQGSLYGRNTTGGALHLLTRKPRGRRMVNLRLGVGNLEHRELEAAWETPLVNETASLRLATLFERRDGHTINLLNGEDENDIDFGASRLQAFVALNEDLALRVKLHGRLNRAGSRAYQSRGLIDGADVLGYVDSADPFTGSYNLDSFEDLDLWGASAHFEWTCPRYTVTSISAYESAERLDREDADASPHQLIEADWSNGSEQFTQEIRIASSTAGRLEWLGGAYFFDQHLAADNRFDLLRELRSHTQGFDPASGIFLLNQIYEQETAASALFGQLAWQGMNNLSWRVGLRYTREEKSIDFMTRFDEPELVVPLITFADRLKTAELSGELGLDYAPRPDLILFATLARGFKSGGWNGGALFAEEEVEPVEPEFVTNFEIGVKSTWLGRRLQLSTAAFHSDYRDLQVFNLVNQGGVPIQFLDNAADAQISGIEVELRATPTSSFDLRLNGALLDARYQRYVQDGGADFSGNRLISAPRWSAAASVTWTHDLRPGRLGVHLNLSARDDVFFESSNNPRLLGEGYTLLGARLSFAPSKSAFNFAVWAKNLTDEVYLIEAFDVSDFGFDQLVIGDPRTYGIELTMRF